MAKYIAIEIEYDKKHFYYYFDKKTGLAIKPLQSYSYLTTLNLPLTERGMEYFNINV